MTDIATTSIPWFRAVDRGAWRALLAAKVGMQGSMKPSIRAR
jgi:hypothetical protein